MAPGNIISILRLKSARRLKQNQKQVASPRKEMACITATQRAAARQKRKQHALSRHRAAFHAPRPGSAEYGEAVIGIIGAARNFSSMFGALTARLLRKYGYNVHFFIAKYKALPNRRGAPACPCRIAASYNRCRRALLISIGGHRKLSIGKNICRY